MTSTPSHGGRANGSSSRSSSSSATTSPVVLAVELVDLPRHAAVLDEVPRLLDQRAFGEREQLARVVERHGILVLLARRDDTA